MAVHLGPLPRMGGEKRKPWMVLHHSRKLISRGVEAHDHMVLLCCVEDLLHRFAVIVIPDVHVWHQFPNQAVAACLHGLDLVAGFPDEIRVHMKARCVKAFQFSCQPACRLIECMDVLPDLWTVPFNPLHDAVDDRAADMGDPRLLEFPSVPRRVLNHVSAVIADDLRCLPV